MLDLPPCICLLRLQSNPGWRTVLRAFWGILLATAGMAATWGAWAQDDTALRACAVADQSGDTELTITLCSQVLGSGRLSVLERAAALLARGNAHARIGDIDKALADYDQTVALQPQVPDLYANRGALYMAKHDYDQAIKDFDAAIRLKPDFALAFSNRGGAYLGKGAIEQAISDLDIAVKLDPANFAPYGVRGIAYVRLAQYGRALKDLNQEVTMASNNPFAFMRRAEAYFRMGNLGNAQEDCAMALMLDPDRDGIVGYSNPPYSFKCTKDGPSL